MHTPPSEGTRSRAAVTLATIDRIIIHIASIGPIGHLPASGTIAVAICGVPLFWLAASLSPTQYAFLLILGSGTAVALHELGGRILGERDSHRLV